MNLNFHSPDSVGGAKTVDEWAKSTFSTRCMTLVTYHEGRTFVTIVANVSPVRERSVFYRRILATTVFIAAGASVAAARDLAVVSNKANGLSAITVPELVKVCKAQTNRWPDGKPVTLIMRAPSAPEMKMMLDKLFELPEAQVIELVASANHGRANHPAILVVDSDEDLVNKVASIPGAVGVVDVYSINSSVSVVKLAGKLPLEPGYLLHGN